MIGNLGAGLGRGLPLTPWVARFGALGFGPVSGIHQYSALQACILAAKAPTMIDLEKPSRKLHSSSKQGENINIAGHVFLVLISCFLSRLTCMIRG